MYVQDSETARYLSQIYKTAWKQRTQHSWSQCFLLSVYMQSLFWTLQEDHHCHFLKAEFLPVTFPEHLPGNPVTPGFLQLQDRTIMLAAFPAVPPENTVCSLSQCLGPLLSIIRWFLPSDKPLWGSLLHFYLLRIFYTLREDFKAIWCLLMPECSASN